MLALRKALTYFNAFEYFTWFTEQFQLTKTKTIKTYLLIKIK